MTDRCKLRNVSTPHKVQYQTHEGNVRVTQFKPRLWQVLQRGYEGFLVRSKAEAFRQACGIERNRSGWTRQQAREFARRIPGGGR